MFADERKPSAAAFLDHAARYDRSLGVRVRCIMTDNAKVFRSLPFTAVCRRWRLRHVFTRLYTPRTNGKAERLIQTALREWAYGRSYRHSRERTAIWQNGCIAITGIAHAQPYPDFHPSAD